MSYCWQSHRDFTANCQRRVSVVTFEKFEDIDAWKKGRQLCGRVYDLTRNESFSKDYSLKDQVRRASVSISSNIAEGFERDGRDEFIQFLSMSKGSAGELRSQLYIAKDEGYISESDFEECLSLCTEVSKLLNGLVQYLKDSDYKGRKYDN